MKELSVDFHQIFKPFVLFFCTTTGETEAFDYSNRKVIWNPRFLNPETDPNFNDFDKSGWNVAAGGAGEFIHHRVSEFLSFFFRFFFYYLLY